MKNLMLVNFKDYKEASSDRAVKLARICYDVGRKHKKEIWVAVQASDIFRVSRKVKIKVLAQHIDPVEAYRSTGFVEATDVKKNGAYGTLLNHSEHKLNFNDLRKAVQMARRAKLKIIICAASPNEVKKVKTLKPDYIAIEPPELIAGNISVSRAKPEVITKSVKLTRIKVLCGAGIKTKEDVEKAIRLGAKGILVSSGIVLIKSPRKVLEDFAKAI
ncbi:MAG: triose-phosphate isomerase [Nanoarchaeota archaeon]